MSEASKIIQSIADGKTGSAEELLPLVYDELRRLARIRLNNERADHTLDATSLVHEAYLRLMGGQKHKWNHRGHFFAAAAEAMRRILIENARSRKQLKRGGDLQRIQLDDELVGICDRDERLLQLDEALTKLQKLDECKARVVHLRFFAGLSAEQTAKAIGISPATVARNWVFARAWLKREMAAAPTEQVD